MILAADIGGTSCKLAIFDPELNLMEKWRIDTDITDSGAHILNDVHKSFQRRLDKSGRGIDDCTGIGIGVPGPVDFDTGMLNGAINLGWTGKKPIARDFEVLSGLKTIVDNDANAAALGEQSFGAGGAHGDVVMLTLGTGVGGGVVTNHRLLHGAHGAAGEIGHIKVDKSKRFSCNCGQNGCLETVASATGMKNLAAYHYEHTYQSTVLSDSIEDGTVTSKDIVAASHEGDLLSQHVLDDMSRYIAYALSTVSAITNPRVIIIGGGVSQAGDMLLDKIDAYYRPDTFPPAVENTGIRLAELGNDAGIYGAARLVEQFIKNAGS